MILWGAVINLAVWMKLGVSVQEIPSSKPFMTDSYALGQGTILIIPYPPERGLKRALSIIHFLSTKFALLHPVSFEMKLYLTQFSCHLRKANIGLFKYTVTSFAICTTHNICNKKFEWNCVLYQSYVFTSKFKFTAL